MQRSPYLKNVRRIVVKIGSGVLTDDQGCLSPPVFSAIVAQVANLLKTGKEVVLVSSGAIASGRALLRERARSTSIPEKQALAAIGQTQLMSHYQEALDIHGIRTAQVLLTRDDLSHRRRYLNARNTLFQLLQFGTLPIVNENDTVMVEEIKFGDNDNLSAQVATLVDADILILLTDAPGLCPWTAASKLSPDPIPFVERITPEIKKMAMGAGSPLGTGGMATKIEAALSATQAGHPVVIAGGRNDGVVEKILQGENIGTFFVPQRDRLTHKKHWIAYSLAKKGELVLDDGAVAAILDKGKSLLPSGIIAVSGQFENGEMVACVDVTGKEWARGITYYSSREIEKIKGKKSSEIEKTLGYRIRDVVIHRDELVVHKVAP